MLLVQEGCHHILTRVWLSIRRDYITWSSWVCMIGILITIQGHFSVKCVDVQWRCFSLQTEVHFQIQSADADRWDCVCVCVQCCSCLPYLQSSHFILVHTSLSLQPFNAHTWLPLSNSLLWLQCVALPGLACTHTWRLPSNRVLWLHCVFHRDLHTHAITHRPTHTQIYTVPFHPKE